MAAVPAAAEARSPAPKRRRLEVPPLPTLSREEYVARMKKVLDPMVKIRAMYSSLAGGIIKDPDLMTLPIHDHAIVRGHAVFDTCSVVAGRLYRVDIHLDRHIASAQRARIPLPYGSTAEECKARMREIIAQTVVASGLRDANVRYFTSAGPGTFAILPDGCTPAFYVVVMGNTAAVVRDEEMKGIREYTVEVPLKPHLLATTKSNNYMLNVLTSMSSKERGGSFGILVDGDGCIAESCVLNCVFVTKDRRLITPSFDCILAGTTVRKVMQLAQALVSEGVLSAVSQERIPVGIARECVEMFLAAGDSHLVPVTMWDDKPVGDGKVGEVTKRIVQLVKHDMVHGTEDHYELPYP